jgi:hypothetical protein
MDHHRVDADQLQEHRIGGERTRHRLLAHGVAAIFDHHDLAVVELDERQGLRQGLGGRPTGLVVEGRDILHAPRP